MDTSRCFYAGWRFAALVLVMHAGMAAADDTGPGAPPKENFLTSLKQAFKSDFDHEVVRGHFEVGTAPDVRRYYCLVDAKTGKREPSGVSGELEKRKDGMTGVKPGAAVTLYSCDSAEQQGILVTSGYVLTGGAATVVAAPKPAVGKAPAAPMPTTGESEGTAPVVAATSEPAGAKVDVAGIRLGMSADEVRAQLKSKKLLDFYESAATLGEGGKRYVNSIAAWTVESSGGDDSIHSGESFQVMLTPVPGHERVMAVIHITDYAPASGFKEGVLQAALAKKYGASGDLASGSTWRVQSDGTIQTGDVCHRRKLFGGVADLADAPVPRANAALKTTPDEFRYEIDHCGVAIVTEDHTPSGAAGGASTVTRLTVSAYSPSIAFEGATAAAQLMQVGASKSAAHSAITTPNL